MKEVKERFRSKVLAMLKGEGKINDEPIAKLMNRRHSGFSVHAGSRIARDDRDGRQALAEHILRNAFSEQKITYLEDTGKVLCRTAMTHGNNKKNFEIFTAEEFIAAITQHIPDKHFQMVRYTGWYSNPSRGERNKADGRADDERKTKVPEPGPVVIEDFDDGWPRYEEPTIAYHQAPELEKVPASRHRSSLPAPLPGPEGPSRGALIPSTQISHPRERLGPFLPQPASTLSENRHKNVLDPPQLTWFNGATLCWGCVAVAKA